LAQSRHGLVHCTCPLSGLSRHADCIAKCLRLTQSGHRHLCA